MSHEDVPWGEYGEFIHHSLVGDRSKVRKGILIKNPISKIVWFFTNDPVNSCDYYMYSVPSNIENTYKYGIKFSRTFTNFTFRKLDI